MKVIINADDFGIDFDRDLGIFFAVLLGHVSSVSVVVTNKISCVQKIMVRIMRKKISVGLHVNLTDNPLIIFNADELCIHKYDFSKPKYNFWRNCLENNIITKKIESEIKAQFDTFVNEFGFIPNHLDGHNHCNIFNKKVNNIFVDYSKKCGIHLRIPYEIITKFDEEIILNSNMFKELDFFRQKDRITLNEIVEKCDLFFKYDFILYNYLCDIYNLDDDINFIGSIYGYFRKNSILYQQIMHFEEDNIVQIMVHPGLYFPFIKHKTAFSNYDRFKEFLSLCKLSIEISKNKKIEIVNYSSKKS